MEEIITRKAEKKDITLIQLLAEKTWLAHYPAIISRAQIDYMLEKMYSENSLEQQMNEGHIFFIAFYRQKPAGFISFVKKNPKRYLLPKFYVDTDIHKKGIGTSLFSFALQELNHPSEIELTVNRQNIKAINFYFKMGFVIDRVADFDIGDGYFMNDFVMVRVGYKE